MASIDSSCAVRPIGSTSRANPLAEPAPRTAKPPSFRPRIAGGLMLKKRRIGKPCEGWPKLRPTSRRRDRVHTIFSDKWPQAGNALSRPLKNIGPQLRGAGIHILWPTRHGDGKVLTVTSVLIDLNKNKENRKTSSRSSDRPPAPRRRS
jgi:hypothetical protein